MTPVLLALAAFVPLTLAAAMVPRGLRRSAAALIPLAPLPALAASLLVQPGETLVLPHVLLGAAFGLDPVRRILLGMAAFLWIAGAIFARGYLAQQSRAHVFQAFFAVAMSGNLGLLVTLDLPSFYVFFSLMTLSSYILVVHDRTDRAFTAGRVYIVLSLVGETALLLGFMGAAALTGSVAIADIGPALATGGGLRDTTLGLLILGFSIKAGQFPLHIWLPLAHSAAPTPASAVLSGAMIKAGLFGLMTFLPLGTAVLPGLGGGLAGMGLFTAFYGVACGLGQGNPKTVLAYSSLSQMGVMVSGLGAALAAPASAPALVLALALYAAHHGFIKAALFFGVGLTPQSVAARRCALVLLAVGGLAIAGAPFSTGAVAKVALKVSLGEGDPGVLLAALLPLSSFATALLMARFLVTACAGYRKQDSVPGAPYRWAACTTTMVGGTVAVWAIASHAGGDAARLSLSPYELWSSLWPVLAAAALAGIIRLRVRRRTFRVAEGDLFALLPRTDFSAVGRRQIGRRFVRVSSAFRGAIASAGRRLAHGVERAEDALAVAAPAAWATSLIAAGFAAAFVIG